MSLKLWQPSKDRKKNSKLFSFERFIEKKFKKKFNINYKKLHKWSIQNSAEFWSSFWDFSKIKGFKGDKKIKRSRIFYKNTFLPNSKLNFGENLLSKNNNEVAATFISENGFKEKRSWSEMSKRSKKIIKFWRK